VHEDAHLAQAAPHARRRKPARIATILFWRRTPVGGGDRRAWPPPVEHGELLAEREVLGDEIAALE
jgi:hypothetical protein